MRMPQSVLRYLSFARVSQRKIRSAVLRQEGSLRGTGDAPWMHFRATERFSTGSIGFAWDAWIRQHQVLPIRVRDSYGNGCGFSAVSLFGIVNIASRGGTPQVAQASLLRFLAESAWIPTFLSDSRIEWESIDDRTARATLADCGARVSADLGFADTGEIVTVGAQRYREVGRRQILTPWRGSYSDYAVIDGMMVPERARVEWVLPEGALEVWRGRLLTARYSFF